MSFEFLETHIDAHYLDNRVYIETNKKAWHVHFKTRIRKLKNINIATTSVLEK